MDLKKIEDEVQQAAGGLIGNNNPGNDGFPGGSVVGGAVQQVVKNVKAKADGSGLGGVFDAIENIVEQKTGMDLDGDGDRGVPNK